VELVPVSDADEAGVMLARTFHDDPYATYALPHAATRPAVLAAAFAWNVVYGRLYGWAWQTRGSLDGVAIFLQPSSEHFSRDRLAASGYERFERTAGPEIWPDLQKRHSAVFGYCDEVIDAVVPEGYFYLDVIGVDVARRGQGVGSALMGAIDDRFGEGYPGSYLLTFRHRTVPFYERTGYEIAATGVEPSSGLEFWVMTRAPRPA
jgi:ribosomal protein S18 acetylase RimI-like enzyme